MNVLVTGGTGLLGRAIVRQAMRAGHDVAVLYRPGTEARLPECSRSFSGTLEELPINEICDFKPEACIHCAWIARPGSYTHDPVNALLVDSSIHLARTLFGSGLRHFLGIGSCLEYAPTDQALEESAALSTNPAPYVVSKLMAFRKLSEVTPPGAIFSWLRVFYLYGPSEPEGKFVTSALRAFAAGETITLQRPHDVVDYIHVDDVAAAALVVMDRRAEGVFNVGSGQPRTVREVAEIAWTASGRQGQISCGCQGEVTTRWAAPKRLKALGWQPSREMLEAVQEMVSRMEASGQSVTP